MTTSYRGYDVYTQGFNSQGPVLLQALNMLEGRPSGDAHNSADYIHTVTEALKLAYADRDTYYADPDFVDDSSRGPAVKGVRAASGRCVIDPRRASKAFVAGNPLPFDSKVKAWPYWVANIEDATTLKQDTLSPEAELLRGILA